jgi:hypothetical protein
MEVHQLFNQSTTSPLAASFLQMHPHKEIPQSNKEEVIITSQDKQSKSPRLSAKSDKGKSVLRLAQDLVAKKCGLAHSEDFQEDMTLQ